MAKRPRTRASSFPERRPEFATPLEGRCARRENASEADIQEFASRGQRRGPWRSGLPRHKAAPAFAQDDEAEESDEEIVVTATGTNISGVKPTGSEAITIDQERIRATGLTTPADVVRTLPQVRNLGDYREGGTQGTGNSQQGNAINLRGLGVGATRTLVDGHRVVGTGAAQNFTEANRVPMAALERIEVIADGASAIYGSDAVAGVINYVLRKDYDGLEASFRASNNSGSWEWAPSITAGTDWDAGGLGHGNILLSYEYTHRDAYLRGEKRLFAFGPVAARRAGRTAQRHHRDAELGEHLCRDPE